MLQYLLSQIKSVWNKDRNRSKYNVFLEKIQMNYLTNTFLYKIWMLYYGKIDVSEENDFHKTSSSKECNICHYPYFLNEEFKFQAYGCNRCH